MHPNALSLQLANCKYIMGLIIQLIAQGGSETCACRQMSSLTTCNDVVNDIVLDKDDVVYDMGRGPSTSSSMSSNVVADVVVDVDRTLTCRPRHRLGRRRCRRRHGLVSTWADIA